VTRRRRSVMYAALLCLALPGRGPVAAGVENPFGAQGLRFGYSTALFADVSIADARTALALWSRELGRQSESPVDAQLIIYDDLPVFVSAIQAGEVDFIALNSLDYLKIRDRVPMEILLFGERGGKAGEEQILLVHRDSGIREVRQLRGKRLTHLRGGSGSIATLWLDTLLAKQRLPPTDRFFGSSKEEVKPQQVILPVFFRQADACLVGRNSFLTVAEMNPQIGKELVILEMSPVYPIAVFCNRATLTRFQKEEFLRLSFRMIDSPAGRQILTLFKVDKIMRVPPTALDELAALVRESEGNRIARKGKPE